MLESFLPLFVNFIGSIRTISPVSAIRLTVYLHFQRSNWSFITGVLVLPLFRHPIELYIGQVGMKVYSFDVISLLKEHHTLREMLADGRLIIKNDEECYSRNV